MKTIKSGKTQDAARTPDILRAVDTLNIMVHKILLFKALFVESSTVQMIDAAGAFHILGGFAEEIKGVSKRLMPDRFPQRKGVDHENE